jgi:hypothetical protein
MIVSLLTSVRQRWQKFARIDADVAATLAFRAWSVTAGAVMVLLIPLWLTPAEQGYYYTFASLLALQVFFELGMNQVILQLVSHDFARLKTTVDGVLAGDPASAGRLAGLLSLLHRWYLVAALAFFVCISAAGAVFLSRQAELPLHLWLGPWVTVTLAAAVNLYYSAMLAVLEGCGEVVGVAKMRFTQSGAGYLAMWLLLAAGGGLWAIAVLPAMAAAYTGYWLHTQGDTLRRLRRAGQAGGHVLHWRRDIFPFQWRIALSWVSGYFIFHLLTPLAFARHGAAEAGRLGITLAVFNALLTVGMSWVNAKVPAMAAHVSRGERRQLNELFAAVTGRATAFTAGAALLVVLALLVLNGLYPLAAQRFASVPVVLCIAVVTVANAFIFSAAAYIRAHKEEPMLAVSLVTGCATLGATVIGAGLGVLPMMLLYMLVSVVLALPWTTALFRRYYRRSA